MRHGTASRIRQGPGTLIAHPTMDSTAAGIEPRNVFKAKILAQTFVHDFDRHGHELPAHPADAGSTAAAATHLVVIGEVNIKDEFARGRCEAARRYRVVIDGWVRKDGSDVDLDGSALVDGGRQFVLSGETLVANVDLFARHGFDRHGELAVRKGSLFAVTQPLVQHVKREETSVVHLQQFGGIDNGIYLLLGGLHLRHNGIFSSRCVVVDLCVRIFRVAVFHLHTFDLRGHEEVGSLKWIQVLLSMGFWKEARAIEIVCSLAAFSSLSGPSAGTEKTEERRRREKIVLARDIRRPAVHMTRSASPSAQDKYSVVLKSFPIRTYCIVPTHGRLLTYFLLVVLALYVVDALQRPF